ncbi:fluoride efflux transporter CrcB [Treponema primitia]|uniref:fluoride efflux transporter CrcB n=1 Tax=Treponema primitia TaxID=88058 RepID=UPI000255529C|nr:fluoride efflux transporter CrcB [Treponema primitia]
MNLLLVILGGGCGAGLRYLSVRGIGAVFKPSFPLGTLAVNAAGALIIGFLFGAFEIRAVPAQFRLFLITGFLGGYTTFSSYSLETVRLFMTGSISAAIANMVLNNLLCLGFTFLGLGLSQKVVPHV